MCQKEISNMARSSNFVEQRLNNRGDGGKGKKRPLLCSKTAEMFKYLKLHVKLVQNMVICCRVWISATADLRGEVKGKVQSLFGPESENSE